MSHYGATPATICDAILTALSAMQYHTTLGVTSGCVKTIGRIESDEPEAISRALTKGTPALLLVYGGGVFSGGTTHGQLFDVEMTFRIYAVSGNLRSKLERLTSGELDPATATDPGLEELLDWATYFAVRAAAAVAGCKLVHPKNHKPAGAIEPGKYVGYTELTASRRFDIWDNALAATLKELGLVHSPTTPATLFMPDNTTPKSDWPPPGVDGGVTVL